MEAEVYPPAAQGRLTAKDPSLDGVGLLGLQVDLWPGGEALFDRYFAGQQVTISSKLSLGQSGEQAIAVLAISAAEVASLLRIGLIVSQQGDLLGLLGEHSRVGLMRLEDFQQLPEDGLDPGLAKRVLIADVLLPPDFDRWLN